MARRRPPRFSIRGPVILFVVVILLIITLTVLWNVVLVHDYVRLRELTSSQSSAFHWSMVAIGSVLFVATIVLSSVLVAQLIHNIRWRQRQSDLLASISHELNSPLSSIKMFAQTLRSSSLTDENRRNFVEKILFDTERLSRLISNILRAAEADHRQGELEVCPEEIAILPWIRRYCDNARWSLGGEKLDLVLEVEESDAWDDERRVARVDPVMFAQVLDNLLDNAIRYRQGARAEVRIRASCAGTEAEPRLELAVIDRGQGVPRGDLSQIFDRFYRSADQSTRGRPGFGIGLHVVRSIVMSHGGTVEAESAGVGQGLTVTLSLPLLAHAEESVPR